MPCGECTITLEDVAMQLGLRVGGAMVTGRRKVLEPSIIYHRFLGRSLNDGEHNFTCLTLAWLRVNFKELSSTATENTVICAARAYIMQLIGGTYAEKHFLWISYSALNIATLILQWVYAKTHVWYINTPVLNFSTIEWYNTDQIMRQFGYR
ncbi:hypothetical protein PVK06_012230 [Gossypium arboreum]|uniref:Aminotransferase-like plant mobile domain-containing protein n=1 Tax=Gossypium arboreum TaxID=29729 RepID=A0ABR0QAY4_GOSAR|nr:hypothetical protein PVK06_012230 [Gossypium arboreum]